VSTRWPGLHLLGVLERGPHGRAAAAAHEQPLAADEPARHAEGRAVLGLDPLVDELAPHHVGHEVVADALDLVGADEVVLEARDDRALGVDADDAAVGDLLLDALGDARHRAARAHRGHEGVELAVAGLDDLAAVAS
jgi:hypothetical protein